MSAPIISVRDLGKRYRLGIKVHDSLRDHLADGFGSLKRLFGDRNPTATGEGEILWAIKGVSFDVQQGEAIGIIGRNGAGKSTLLKILSQITEPTEGEIRIRGEVASLLEVGTGFHPELSGRENIFLNGAILGMTRLEIKRKFDEIVAFAEVENFLDTPVKRYSSGMYVRLAFAVAAHLDPDILIVDEVLAVGDVQFQKKCLGKMQDVAAREGRTVLFVSHNMGAIGQLCSRCILLEKGRVALEGPAIEVIRHYHGQHLNACPEWIRSPELKLTSPFTFRAVTLTNRLGQKCSLFHGNEPIVVTIEFEVERSMGACQISVPVINEEGVVVFTACDGDSIGCATQTRQPGRFRVGFTIPGHFLRPGLYNLSAHCHFPSRSWLDRADQAVAFEVTPFGSLIGVAARYGITAPLLSWTSIKL